MPFIRVRTAVITGLCLAMVTSVGGCSALQGPAGERDMTVFFPKARSFYPGSKVKIMGSDVGSVDKVENTGDRIRVRFHLRRDIPLPDNVKASIVPLNLVGERNLVLHPAWQPGQPKETDDTIPIERTDVPVEVDDALSSFTNLSNALDPTKVNSALHGAAQSFNGNGQDFNATLEQAGRLIESVAGQDKNLLAVAQNLDRLAGVVRGRENVLGEMIHNFGEATRVLSAERGELQDLVRGVVELTGQGDKLLQKYKGRLPYDIAVLTRVSLMLKGQSERLAQLIKALPAISSAFIGGYSKQTKSLQLRFALDAFLRTWISGIQGTDEVPCPLPPPNSNCPWQKNGGGR